MAAFIILNCTALRASAEVLYHWRFEEGAFLEDWVSGTILDDYFDSQFQRTALPRVDGNIGVNQGGEAFPTSFQGIGPNKSAMENLIPSRGLFARGTTPVEEDYTIEMFTHIDSFAENPNGIVLATQNSGPFNPASNSWMLMVRTDGLFGAQHGELVAWSSDGAKFEFHASGFVLEEGTDYYVGGRLDLSNSEYTFFAQDLTNKSPLQEIPVPQTLGKLTQNSTFKIGSGESFWSPDGLIDEVRFSNHALSVDELLPNLGTALFGDFDNSGELDEPDLALLADVIATETHDTTFDVTVDGLVDQNDLHHWIKNLKHTWIGDANLDGEFNSGDLVQVFQAGHYEDGIANNSTWTEGDWNADSEFDTGDLVLAFQDGGFELGQRMAAVTVPEPTPLVILITSFIAVAGCRRFH